MKYPKLVIEWHPTKNGKLTPDAVSYGSGRKVSWLCANGHEWKTTINNRTNHDSGCPDCAVLDKHVSDNNRLSMKYPKLVIEWHPTKNGELTPSDVSYGSGDIVWWLCPNGHEWDTAIRTRSQGSGCPYCSGRLLSDDNRLSLKVPELVAEWHPIKNGELTPDNVSYGSSRKVWWRCKRGHEWEYTIADRSRGIRCPHCPGKRVTDDNRLSLKDPKLATEWHPTKNGTLTPGDVALGSHKRVWWICRKDSSHDWPASVKNRTLVKAGCPYCAGKRVTDNNRISTHYPDIAEEWHSSKNGDLTPDNLSYGSNKKAWWLCKSGHEWPSVISSRTLNGSGCPDCAGNIVTDKNRLSTNRSDIAKEWHPTKNGALTPDDVAVASNRKVWWICANRHEWEAAIPSRTHLGNGCRDCSLPHRSKIEILLACELATFFDDVDPTQAHKIKVSESRSMEVDIVIPSERLVIEYDGYHWHEGKLNRDIDKTEALQFAGWNVLRIREEPLELVLDTDLQCPVTFPNHIKNLVDSVLIHLDEEFGIEVPELDDYLTRNSLVNADKANDIIGDELSNQ